MSALVAGYCLSLRLRADGSDGWEPHDVLEGDGHGGWTRHAAQRRFLPHHNVPGSYTMPFGLLQMDNGEVILAGSWNDGSSTKADLAEKCFVAFSRDRGDHWSDFSVLSDAFGRRLMLSDLGRGRLMFQTDPLRPVLPRQFFSADYGRSWPQSRLLQKAANDGTIAGPSDEGIFATEGNALVDHDSGARAIRIAEIGWNLGKGKQDWPRDPAIGILRWSSDGGRTWTGEIEPPAWRHVTEFGGRKYLRGVCEGSLVRQRPMDGSSRRCAPIWNPVFSILPTATIWRAPQFRSPRTTVGLGRRCGFCLTPAGTTPTSSACRTETCS